MEQTRQCTPSELGYVMDTYGTMVYRLAYSQLTRVRRRLAKIMKGDEYESCISEHE